MEDTKLGTDMDLERVKELLETTETTQASLCIESRARVVGLDKAVASCLRDVQHGEVRSFLQKLIHDYDYFRKVLSYVYINDVCTSIHIYAIYSNMRRVGLADEVCEILYEIYDVLSGRPVAARDLLSRVMERYVKLVSMCIVRRDLTFNVSLGVLTDILARLVLLEHCRSMHEGKVENCDNILQSLRWRLDVVHACCREREGDSPVP